MGRRCASSDPRDRSVPGLKAFALWGPALVLLILFLLMALTPDSASAATHWLTVQLTDNDTYDRNVSIDGPYVAWSGIDTAGGGDVDIFLRDLASATTSNLSNNAVSSDDNPIVDGTLVAWCMNETPTSADPDIPHIQIMVHDLGPAATTQLTDGDNWMHLAENRAGHLCFYGAVAGNTMEVFYYDAASGVTTQVTDNDDRDMDGSADGDRIAWTATTELFPFIMVHNFVSHVTMPLSLKGSHVQGRPIVRGNTLAFMERVGTDWEVYVKDLVTGTQTRVSDDDVDSYLYSFDGERLLWGDADSPFEDEPATGDLYIYDVATHTSHAITGDDLTNPSSVVMAGDLVVWISEVIPGDHDSGEIFVHDLSTGDTQQLTHNRHRERSLDTDGLRIAWTGATGGAGLDSVEVFVATSIPRLFPYFHDVRISHPYFAAIQALRMRDLFGGYTVGWNTDFRPDEPLFRAQFAKMLCNAFDISVSEGMSSPFADLGPDDPDNLYPHEFVAAARSAGITNGTSATMFSPYANVSRAQVVTMMVRAAQQLKPGHLVAPPAGYTGSLPSFSDIHDPTMRIAEFNGLLKGVQGFGALWNPWASATRGETAQMLWNLLSGAMPRA